MRCQGVTLTQPGVAGMRNYGEEGGAIGTDAPKDNTSRVAAPERYLKWLFWAGAAGLTPWIWYLYLTQLPHARAHQIRLLAAGLLLAMIAGILLTALTYSQGRSLATMSASFTATATFISAWFRTVTQTGGSSWAGSIPAFLAVVVAIIVLCVAAISSGLRRTPAPRSRWLPIALAVGAIALAPSLVVVLVAVPADQVAHHLRLAWTGLDVFEVLALAATGFALHRRPAIAVVPATVTGTLLVCDAWINVIPATAGARLEGILLALVELPFAALSFWVAARAASKSPGT
jgi:hypothetical protein